MLSLYKVSHQQSLLEHILILFPLYREARGTVSDGGGDSAGEGGEGGSNKDGWVHGWGNHDRDNSGKTITKPFVLS